MMIVSSSGYYATGSSAIYDLLKEYKYNTTGIIREKEYEHILFYTPGGLFDLEDKLLIGNSIHRSDEAIKCFINEANRLYQYDFGWFGSYKKMIGKNFLVINNNFINNLVQFRVNAHWSYHIRRIGFSPKKIKNSIRNIFHGKKIRGKFWQGYYYDDNNEIVYSFPTKDEFYKHAKQYVLDYFNCIYGQETSKNLILNHAVLPQQAERLYQYDINNFYVIVVDRDPRDVYTYVKYVGNQRGVKSRIPTDLYEFIDFWKALRANKIEHCPKMLNIRFEDLIYHYDKTVNLVEKFLGLNKKDHIDQYKYFNPTISIENTQIYRRFEGISDEIEIIEKALPDYIYSFPKRILQQNIAIEQLGNIHLYRRGETT